jgi:hypothetical protein
VCADAARVQALRTTLATLAPRIHATKLARANDEDMTLLGRIIQLSDDIESVDAHITAAAQEVTL